MNPKVKKREIKHMVCVCGCGITLRGQACDFCMQPCVVQGAWPRNRSPVLPFAVLIRPHTPDLNAGYVYVMGLSAKVCTIFYRFWIKIENHEISTCTHFSCTFCIPQYLIFQNVIACLYSIRLTCAYLCSSSWKARACPNAQSTVWMREI